MGYGRHGDQLILCIPLVQAIEGQERAAFIPMWCHFPDVRGGVPLAGSLTDEPAADQECLAKKAAQ